jgi:acetate kinase
MDEGILLTLNAGSSSLKYAAYTRKLERLASGTVGRIGAEAEGHRDALSKALASVAAHGEHGEVRAIGHRVVHGGDRFVAPVRVDDAVVAALRELAALDPNHMPAAIALIDAVKERYPSAPQVACFDTAFHATMPRVAMLLPVPRRLEAAGVRRYGFHGLSYQSQIEQLGRAARGRVVMAHLGNGTSLCAARDGISVDTTMGFTPAGGVPMGTRTGDLDPGVLVHLLRTEGATADALDDLVNRRSGLLGVSGTSGDMRDLLAREGAQRAAAEAVELYCYSIRKAVGALAAALEGIDTLVFAGGIGENSPVVRARVCAGLAHLGVAIDIAANAESASVISAHGSACAVRVVRTDEEAVIARETAKILGG